jgi:hypothetical protein
MTEPTFNVKIEKSGEPARYLRATFTRTDLGEAHPLNIYGEVFKASMMEAAKAFEDPAVREVPIYEAGSLKPVAYLRRFDP